MSQLDRIESALAVLLERTKPHEDSLEACERSFHTPEPPPLGESPPSLAGAFDLAASPGVRDGDAPQGQCLTMREAVESMRKHHYSSSAVARSSLRTWIESGKIPDVRIERAGDVARLFPREQERQ